MKATLRTVVPIGGGLPAMKACPAAVPMTRALAAPPLAHGADEFLVVHHDLARAAEHDPVPEADPRPERAAAQLLPVEARQDVELRVTGHAEPRSEPDRDRHPEGPERARRRRDHDVGRELSHLAPDPAGLREIDPLRRVPRHGEAEPPGAPRRTGGRAHENHAPHEGRQMVDEIVVVGRDPVPARDRVGEDREAEAPGGAGGGRRSGAPGCGGSGRSPGPPRVPRRRRAPAGPARHGPAPPPPDPFAPRNPNRSSRNANRRTRTASSSPNSASE